MPSNRESEAGTSAPNDAGTPDPAPKPLARHLIDLNNPRPRPQKPGMGTKQVQRWVMSLLVFTIFEHLAAGLVVAAIFSPHSNTAARIGLNIIAAVLSVAAIGAVRAIHGRNLVSAWPALGVVVGIVGYYLTVKF